MPYSKETTNLGFFAACLLGLDRKLTEHAEGIPEEV